jgi:hypothetical protein
MLSAYLAASSVLRARLLGLVAASYAGQGDYRDAAAAAFVTQAVPAVQAAQQTMAGLTSAYLAHMISSTAGGTAAPVGVPAELLGNLRGVDPAEVYRRPYVQVWTDLSRGKSLDDAVAAGSRRAQSIASTDLQMAKTKAAQVVMQHDERVTGYRRVLVGAHSCALCVLASTRWYSRGDLLPIHPGCVIGNTTVSNIVGSFADPTFSSNIIKAATRRNYTGKLLTIATATGQQVTITPNHPILTDRGWVPAQFIHEGDSVVSCGISHRAVNSCPDKKQIPSLIEDVWCSGSVSGFIRMPLTTEDFHGDGSDSEVDIVYADGNFPAIGNLPAIQPVSELLLMTGQRPRVPFYGLGTNTPLFPSGFTSGSRDVGSLSLSSTLLGGHLCSAHDTCIRPTSGINPAIMQRTTDSSALCYIGRSQSKLGFSGEVPRGYLGVGEFSPSSPSRRFDPPAVEFSGQSLGVYARLGSSLLNRLSGKVHRDRVVSVTTGAVMDCHVFNLHTGEGWYNAGGLIVSNCDCAVAPLVGGTRPDEIPAAELHAIVSRDLGDKYVSASGKKGPIDYRSIVVTHDHGELGPVLGVRGQNFIGPSDIPGG